MSRINYRCDSEILFNRVKYQITSFKVVFILGDAVLNTSLINISNI